MTKTASAHPALSPAQIMVDRARQLARPPETAQTAEARLALITFKRSGEHYGLPTGLVYETQPLRAHHWTRVPSAPAFIVGLVNLRGHIYSITDLAAFWGLPGQPLTEQAHLLVVRGGQDAEGRPMELALLADGLPAERQTPLSELHPAPATINTLTLDHIRGVTPDLLIVIDLERLLSDPRLVVHEII